jgi:hypothetical protein
MNWCQFVFWCSMIRDAVSRIFQPTYNTVIAGDCGCANISYWPLTPTLGAGRDEAGRSSPNKLRCGEASERLFVTVLHCPIPAIKIAKHERHYQGRFAQAAGPRWTRCSSPSSRWRQLQYSHFKLFTSRGTPGAVSAVRLVLSNIPQALWQICSLGSRMQPRM